MKRLLKLLMGAALAAWMAGPAGAFSLLGPFDTWQQPAIGYNVLGTDPGGPMNIGEEYRWNLPTIYYAFDQSFLNYFGTRGAAEIDKAFQILNNLPPCSQMNANLAEYPLKAREINTKASALLVQDVKSLVLSLLLTGSGLADSVRFTWTLRNRMVLGNPARTNYWVIGRNFDPLSNAPTRVVNGVLYTYHIEDPVQLYWPTATAADAVEEWTDPLALDRRPIASRYPLRGRSFGTGSLSVSIYYSTPLAGEYFTGLTRDDVAGWRHLYGPNRIAMENLPTGVTNAGPIDPNQTGYIMIFPTNFVAIGTNTMYGTNAPVMTGLRPGVNKLTFVRANYDTLLGQFFAPITNNYKDLVITNYVLVEQNVGRVVLQPDILFLAGDLGVYPNTGAPIPWTMTTAQGVWISNDAINGQTTQAGPGVIPPAVTRITLTTLLPYYFNQSLGIMDAWTEATATRSGVWGSFDVSTNLVIYPDYLSLRDLEQRVLGGQP